MAGAGGGSWIDLNAPSAGELLGAAPNVKDGSKGAKNIKRGNGKGLTGRATERTPIEQPPKTRYEMRRNYLNLDRETWRAHWLDVKNLFLPYRTRWLDDGGVPNRGQKKMQYVVDNTPMIALRTMQAGLMYGMTSPSRPWFRFRPEDDDVYEQPGVAEWCERATDALHRVLAKSNFYRTMPQFYSEIGGFGTGALGCFEVKKDPRKRHQPLVTTQTYTAGEYWISQNDENIVDTFYRKFKWTVRQVIEKFVEDPHDENSRGWENISPATIGMWHARKWDQWIDVVHVIEPNEDYVPGAFGVRGMQTRSVYYELGGNPETLLGVKGFPDRPVHVARWDVNSDNVWGHSPAMYCLGDSKQLMVQQKRKMQAIDKLVEPPLIGDAAFKRQSVSQLPGDVTWLENASANTFGVKPLYEVKPQVREMIEDLQETRLRIKTGMYEDVFQMMRSLSDQLKAGITATEIDARKQEQLLELGPLLDRLTGELLEPLIDQIFGIMVARSKMAWQYMQAGREVPPSFEMFLPPPPKALQGVKLKVDYISILAQAVRIAEIQGINQVTSYIMTIVEAKPEVMDKFDFDKAIAIMADRLGVPPECIVQDQVVADIRDARAKQQAKMQAMQNVKEGAPAIAGAAKDLGQTPVGDGSQNALDQLLNGPKQQQAA